MAADMLMNEVGGSAVPVEDAVESAVPLKVAPAVSVLRMMLEEPAEQAVPLEDGSASTLGPQVPERHPVNSTARQTLHTGRYLINYLS